MNWVIGEFVFVPEYGIGSVTRIEHETGTQKIQTLDGEVEYIKGKSITRIQALFSLIGVVALEDWQVMKTTSLASNNMDGLLYKEALLRAKQGGEAMRVHGHAHEVVAYKEGSLFLIRCQSCGQEWQISEGVQESDNFEYMVRNIIQGHNDHPVPVNSITLKGEAAPVKKPKPTNDLIVQGAAGVSAPKRKKVVKPRRKKRFSKLEVDKE